MHRPWRKARSVEHRLKTAVPVQRRPVRLDAFAIDKAFGIKMPLEQWTQDVNEGRVSSDQYFVLKDLCANIDNLVAAKVA